MAIKKTIIVDVKSKDAIKNLENVDKSVKKVDKSSEDLKNTTDTLTGGMSSRFRGLKGTIGVVIKSFKSLKIAIIGTGIGALVIAVVALAQAFTKSEEGQNKWAKIMGVLGSVVGNFTDLLAELGDMIIWVFENPKKAIAEFTKIIKEQIINRFTGLLELIPKLGESIVLLFQGKFKEAGKVATNAMGKVTLGIDNVVDATKKAINKTKEFIKELEREAIIAAKIADLRANADIKERELIVERANADLKISELRFKAEQRDLYSAQKRLEFLKEAAKVEGEINQKQMSVIADRVRAKYQELQLDLSNKEVETELAELQAQLINLGTKEANLKKRLETRIQALIVEARTEASQKQKNEDEDYNIWLKQVDREEKLNALKDKNAEAERKRREKSNEDLQAYLEEQDNIENSNEDLRVQRELKLKIKKDKQREDDIRADKLLNKQKVAFAANAFGAISSIVGKQTAAGKAAAAASALINTYQGISNVWAEKAESGLVGAGLAQRLITTGIVAAQGFMAVKNILKTPVPGGGGGGRISAPGNIQQVQPNFNVVGASDTNQLAQSISNKNQEPIKAFVVSEDVTTQQSLDRQITDTATFG